MIIHCLYCIIFHLLLICTIYLTCSALCILQLGTGGNWIFFFLNAISCYDFFLKCVKLLLKLRRSIAKLMLKDHVSGMCVLEHKTRICTVQKLSGSNLSKLDFFSSEK